MLEQTIKEIYVELSDKCFLNCRHCSSSASPEGRNILHFEYVNNLLFQGKLMGATCLTLSGGEPLLYTELWKVLELASSLKYSTRVYTSGIIEINNKLKALDKDQLSQFKLFNIDSLIFSLHGSNAATHDYITKKNGSFYLTIESIKNASKLGIPIEVHTVPMSINYKEIQQIVDTAEKYGANRVSLLRLVPHGNCLQNPHLIMNKKETSEFTKIVNNVNSHLIRKGAPFKCLFLDESGTCSAGKDKVLIGPSGMVFPCEAFKSDLPESNIKTMSLKDIWNTDLRINEIRGFDHYNIETCNQCSNLTVCHGGCPGQRWLQNGDICIGPDPVCLVH